MRKRILGVLLILALVLPGMVTVAQAAPKQVTQLTVTPAVVVGADSVKMSVTVQNPTKKTVSLEYSSSQRYDFQLLDLNGKSLYTWSADKSFMQSLGKETIKAGKSLTYTETLSGKSYKAIKDKIAYLKVSIPTKSALIDQKGYTIQFKMNKDVTVTPFCTMNANSFKMSLTIKNKAKTDVVIQHTSGQKYEFQLLDMNRKVLYTWSADKTFAAALSTTVLKGGRTLTFSETLSGAAFTAIKDKVAFMRAFVVGTGNFINKDGYEVKTGKYANITVAPRASLGTNVVRMGITIKNGSLTPITIDHPSGQKYDFQLLDANYRVLYTWSADKLFAQAKSSTKVIPNKSVTYDEELSGSAYAAIKDRVVYFRATITGSADFLSGGYVLKLR